MHKPIREGTGSGGDLGLAGLTGDCIEDLGGVEGT